MNAVTIARYDTMPEAHIAMGSLHAADIDAWLADEHLVQTDWLYSIAVGGIKLQVNPADVEKALAVLSEDFSDSVSEDSWSGTQD